MNDFIQLSLRAVNSALFYVFNQVDFPFVVLDIYVNLRYKDRSCILGHYKVPYEEGY